MNSATIWTLAVSASCVIAAADGHAFTNQPGGGAQPSEPSTNSPAGNSGTTQPNGYNFSGRNFNFSVEKTDRSSAEGSKAAVEGTPAPAAPKTFIGRTWGNVLNIFGLGD